MAGEVSYCLIKNTILINCEFVLKNLHTYYNIIIHDCNSDE